MHNTHPTANIPRVTKLAAAQRMTGSPCSQKYKDQMPETKVNKVLGVVSDGVNSFGS